MAVRDIYVWCFRALCPKNTTLNNEQQIKAGRRKKMSNTDVYIEYIQNKFDCHLPRFFFLYLIYKNVLPRHISFYVLFSWSSVYFGSFHFCIAQPRTLRKCCWVHTFASIFILSDTTIKLYIEIVDLSNCLVFSSEHWKLFVWRLFINIWNSII